MNGKLRIVQNPKQPESDTDDDNDDNEEMPEETGTPAKVYDTDGELTSENLEKQIRPSNRNSKKPNRYGSIPYIGNIWGQDKRVK